MNVLIFGATGMVGLGVLRECLRDPSITKVQTVGRTATNQKHPKLVEYLHPDLFRYESIESELTNFDACFFCLGKSSGGMSESEYEKVTYDLTLAAASILARLNPAMTFIYVSGAGTDSSEQGKTMWARVKGKTENALLKLSFAHVYLFRPGVIQPLYGIESKTPAYRWLYKIIAPLLPLARHFLPTHILTTEQVGSAMINAARYGATQSVLESPDIYLLAMKRSQI